MLSAVLRPLLLLLLPLHHKQERQAHPLASCHHNSWTIASVPQDGRLHLCFKTRPSSHLPVEDSLPRIVRTLLPVVHLKEGPGTCLPGLTSLQIWTLCPTQMLLGAVIRSSSMPEDSMELIASQTFFAGKECIFGAGTLPLLKPFNLSQGSIQKSLFISNTGRFLRYGNVSLFSILSLCV